MTGEVDQVAAILPVADPVGAVAIREDEVIRSAEAAKAQHLAEENIVSDTTDDDVQPGPAAEDVVSGTAIDLKAVNPSATAC